MFRGSIPADMQRVMSDVVSSWDCDAVSVGCSGNFTVERCIAALGKRMHSNDVTLYSTVLGRYFAGEPMKLELADDPRFAFLGDYLGSPEDTVATVMLSTQLADLIGKDNRYYRRMLDAFRAQWPTLHRKTREKIEGARWRLATYDCEDVLTWIERQPESNGFICYPPFTGSLRSNERDWMRIDPLFQWDRPDFQVLSDEVRARFFERVRHFRHWAFGANRLQPEFAENLVGRLKPTNRSPTFYLYASHGPKRIITPQQDLHPLPFPHLQPGQEIGDNLRIVTITHGQFALARSEYFNHNIRPGAAALPIAVLVNGVLVGVFAFGAMNAKISWERHLEGPAVYMLSDFPVSHTSYPRLAKLVLYAALSRESRLLAERRMKMRLRACVTTAFTNNAASMKYRGLFRLVSRTENDSYQRDWAADLDPNNTYYRHRYELNYAAPLGEWNLSEGLALWKQKHGQMA